MFGIKLPGFMNPLTPFKNAFAVAETLGKNVTAVASTPVKMAQHELNIFKDVLTLDLKGAASNQAKLVTEPLRTGQEVAGNQVGLVKKLLGNLF